MRSSSTLRRVSTALVLLVAFLIQVTWALAGTTGGLRGNVTDASGKPLANVKITASSPSQTSSTQTDASGHFILLTLAPDTYTISAVKKDYTPTSLTGTSVFADEVQTIAMEMRPLLVTIANVTSRSAGSLVKSGVTADTYSVNSTAIQKSAALGGGGNLDSAYSAIASVPGVTVGTGGMGWNQAVFIRGSQFFFTSFEYDGVPVNRAFDNYTSSTESNLGLQELQVYTGGGPSSNSSSGTSGFINQVIKTGTFPGFASAGVGISAPQYYHQAKVEVGGASPNRNFSYYAGLSGYNQANRLYDNQNGADLVTPDGPLAFFSMFTAGDNLANSDFRGVLPLCNSNGTSPIPAIVTSCFDYNPAAAFFGQGAQISDRENIVNLHFGIPRKSGRDDLQLLWSASSMNTQFYSSVNDGGGYGPFTLAVTGSPYQPGVNFPQYIDAQVYDLPFGTPIAGHSLTNYLQPSSTPNRELGSQLPADMRDAIYNDANIVKAQYTHPLSDSAYVRLFGYTFFSDWTQAGASGAYNNYFYGIGGPVDGAVAANYDLITHTAGGEFQFADQINPKNLVQFTANYTQASVSRFNNTGYIGGSSPIGYVSESNGKFQCWDPASGQESTCNPGAAYYSTSVDGPTGNAPAGSPAAQAGAQWVTLWNGNANGTFNTVKPKFAFLSLTDEFRPTDRLLLNLGLRYEDYTYGLANSDTPWTSFYAGVVQNDICVNDAGTVLTKQLKPGQPPPAPVLYELNCQSGFHHPSSFSATSPSSYGITAYSPRISLTYTQSADTVWRASAGRYTEPPISASTQYLARSGNAISVWAATLPLGFNSPFHPIPAMSAAQYDLSFERHIRGTDVSFKLTPFYNLTNGYQEQAFIGPNFVTQAPVGAFKSYGVEAALSKGDFNRNGLSGQLSLTYTDAKVQYQDRYYGTNQIATTNTVISAFNQLTKGGGGSPCYAPSTKANPIGAGEACTTTGAILNPYYSMNVQPLLDPSGWYAPGSTGLSPSNNPNTTYFDSPFTAALILNYRKNKLAITPSIQYLAGSSYGGPMDVAGLDPRVCGENSATAGITAASPNTNPLQCDYLTLTATQGANPAAAPQLFIPNPQTGTFAKPGAYRDPGILLGNIAVSYELSPRITAQMTVADAFHTCFGGSKEPWTAAYAPGRNVCAYGVGGALGNGVNYISNFYNGTGPNDVAANGVKPYPWQTQSYLPTFGSAGASQPLPINVYFNVQVKL